MEGIHGVDVSWLHHSPKGTHSSLLLASTKSWKLMRCGSGRCAKFTQIDPTPDANDSIQTTIQRTPRSPLLAQVRKHSQTSRIPHKAKTSRLHPKPMDPILHNPIVMYIVLISFSVRAQKRSSQVSALPRTRKILKQPQLAGGIRGCQA